eukprot:TRINITY_DN20912_c0_g1_i1.p2 TRINITY_DN20912_c0_g1~~TRINITY_DN20912_c0_g1_i1.p2  ORF type:complete len:146 (+),score=49.23 TRINITY_DN20912_c0_g1_i1:136-573(+)
MDFLSGTASLVDEVDKKLLVVLRDGKKLVGVLRSFDQFANLVLEDTWERVHVGRSYGERRLGVFLVRGENVVLMGELDVAKDNELPFRLQKIPFEEAERLYKEERQRQAEEAERKQKMLLSQGLQMDAFTFSLLSDPENVLNFDP